MSDFKTGEPIEVARERIPEYFGKLKSYHQEHLVRWQKALEEHDSRDRAYTAEELAQFTDWARASLEDFNGLSRLLNDTTAILRGLPDIRNFLSHDIGNEAARIQGFLQLTDQDIKTGPEHFFIFLRKVIKKWERCLVAMEDVMLRAMDKERVPEEYCHDFDLSILQKALEYFKSDELSEIKKFSITEGHQFYLSAGKLFTCDIDWEGIQKKLKNKEVVGNTGVVGNFLLNACRNSLKYQIEASFCQVDIFVDGDNLVLRVADNGKGIGQEHLNLDNPDCVFKQGSSYTQSTGLGLTNAPQRLISMRAIMRVASHRRGEEKENHFTYPEGAMPDLRLGDQPQGTVFEIRLPIKDKK